MLARLCEFLETGKKDVLFLSSSPIDEVWTRTTAEVCHAMGLKVEVAICAPHDKADDLLGHYLRVGIPIKMNVSFGDAAKIKTRLVVTASSGLDRKIFPTKAAIFIHMPHSLASLHMIYPEGSFNGYDVLFAASEQQQREFAAINRKTGAAVKPSYVVGYGKLDVLAQMASRRVHQPAVCKTVLLAPSWGPDNLLDKCGPELVRALIGVGYSVVVRPHPLFILDHASVLDSLRKIATEDARLSIESPFDGDDAIFKADVLIGDYSGIGFEFAALRQRPVVSVNVGLKVANPNWMSHEIQPIEIACRSSIGPVVNPKVNEIILAVELALQTGSLSNEELSRYMHGSIGSCGQNAAMQIQNLLKNL